MPYTRTQANALLTQAEMELFDESRANAVRKLDGKALAGRVERTRKLRDKARDQLQRQKLASRSRTGSKRGTSGDANRRSKDKAELLADILKRFEVQARTASKQGRGNAAARKSTTKTTGKTTAGGKAPARKAATKKAATKKTATKKTATKKAAKGKSAASKAPARQSTVGAGAKKASAAGPGAGAKPGKRVRKGRKGPISPEQALANTRALLEAKKRHDREGAAWQHIDGAASPAAGPYQSPEARSRAEELHAGESRMTAIEGSISTRGRKNQAKRDKR